MPSFAKAQQAKSTDNQARQKLSYIEIFQAIEQHEYNHKPESRHADVGKPMNTILFNTGSISCV